LFLKNYTKNTPINCIKTIKNRVMKRNFSLLLFIGFFAVLMINACAKDEVELPDHLEYVGSEQCASCHKDIHANFMESGHPYKVMKVVNGQAPTIPFMPTPVLPDGYTWNDISYTVGGFGWKMRFVDKNGYMITQVAGSQWNPANNSKSIYNGSIPNGTEKYTCGKCHTTGWKSVAEGGQKQDNLPGMDGEFFAGGVHCEACHGQGNVHVFGQQKKLNIPSNLDVKTDKSNDLCANCHYRRWDKGDLKQQVSGGWEMHRNQIEQLATNKHNALTCNGCHDPHASTTKDALAKGHGVKPDKTCSSCHTNTTKYAATMHYGATCASCHMPKTVRNAISTNKYMGDAPNHNFKINTSATDTYLTADANGVLWANIDKKGSTLDFSCYSCHKDESGVGGTKSIKTRAELSAKAVTFHK
jgi:predicted CXXCH cytochrome family protein